MFGARTVYWRGVASFQGVQVDVVSVPGVTCGCSFLFRELLVDILSAPPNRRNKQPHKCSVSTSVFNYCCQLILLLLSSALHPRAKMCPPCVPPQGSSMSGQLTNSASWLASTCFACTASVLSSTRSASTSSATSPAHGGGGGGFIRARAGAVCAPPPPLHPNPLMTPPLPHASSSPSKPYLPSVLQSPPLSPHASSSSPHL